MPVRRCVRRLRTDDRTRSHLLLSPPRAIFRCRYREAKKEPRSVLLAGSSAPRLAPPPRTMALCAPASRTMLSRRVLALGLRPSAPLPRYALHSGYSSRLCRPGCPASPDDALPRVLLRLVGRRRPSRAGLLLLSTPATVPSASPARRLSPIPAGWLPCLPRAHSCQLLRHWLCAPRFALDSRSCPARLAVNASSLPCISYLCSRVPP